MVKVRSPQKQHRLTSSLGSFVQYCLPAAEVPEGRRTKLTGLFMQLRKMALHPLLHRWSFPTYATLTQRSRYEEKALASITTLLLRTPEHRDCSAALVREDLSGGLANPRLLHRMDVISCRLCALHIASRNIAVMSDFEIHQLCMRHETLRTWRLDRDVLGDSGKCHQLLQVLSERKARVSLFACCKGASFAGIPTLIYWRFFY